MSSRIDRREGGSALIVTVLLLVLLGVIGLAGLDTVTRDQQVAGFQNRNRLAFYAAEAGLADAKDRLRDVEVFAAGAVVAFPDEAASVSLGDAAAFPFGQPRYYGDPDAVAGSAIASTGDASVDTAGGHDLRVGGEQWFNTLWRIQVVGEAPGGTVSRVDAIATRQFAGGY